MKNLKFVAMELVILLTWAVMPAQAVLTSGFVSITNNDPFNAAIGSAQISLDVTAVNSDMARFVFSNTGAEDAVISGIYFEDPERLLSFDSFDPFTSGVSFRQITRNLNLPGGNQPAVNFDESFGFAALPPPSHNGVNPAESLGIVFDLQGTTFEQLLDDIETGEVRVGIHVIGFEDGGSESFVNGTVPNGNGNVIPAPAAVLLVVTGTALVGALRRRHSPIQ